MSDNEIKFSKITYSKLPDMPDTGEAMKAMRAAIAKAMSMQIDKLIVEGDKSTSSTLRESYAIRADYFNRVRKDIVLQESTLNKQLLDSIHESMRKRSFDEMLKRTILDTCEQAGAHADRSARTATSNRAA
jgi:hypothetical protein